MKINKIIKTLVKPYEQLQKIDPTIYSLIQKEVERQKNSINLIASENIV